jgi:hypothetical protein
MYISNVKSKEEFLLRFNNIFNTLKAKQQKTTAEEILFEKLVNVKNNILDNIPLPSNKKSYANFLPFFEIAGGMNPLAKKQSDFWQEAIDLMNFFVQNY